MAGSAARYTSNGTGTSGSDPFDAAATRGSAAASVTRSASSRAHETRNRGIALILARSGPPVGPRRWRTPGMSTGARGTLLPMMSALPRDLLAARRCPLGDVHPGLPREETHDPVEQSPPCSCLALPGGASREPGAVIALSHARSAVLSLASRAPLRRLIMEPRDSASCRLGRKGCSTRHRPIV